MKIRSLTVSLLVFTGVSQGAFMPPPFVQPVGYQQGYQGFPPPYQQQAPQQNAFGYQQPFSDPIRRNVNPAIRSANVMLGRWKAIIEQNKNNPSKITAPLKVIEEDATTLRTALKAMRGYPSQQINEYQILGDLLLLARLRQFTATLPMVKKGFVQSLKDVLFPNQRNPDQVDEESGAGQEVEWYQDRLATMNRIIADFSQRISPHFQDGRKPPFLLTGYAKSMTEAEHTRDTYTKFVNFLENPGSDEALAYRKKIEGRSGGGQQTQGLSQSRSYAQSYGSDQQDIFFPSNEDPGQD